MHQPKNVLVIPGRLPKRAHNGRLLLDVLCASKLFQVRRQEIRQITEDRRWQKDFLIFRINNVTVGLDTWDLRSPSNAGHERFHELNLLIKIQYRADDAWDALARQYNLHISNWTMFGYARFPYGYFRWVPTGHKYLYAFSGHAKRTKRRWIAHVAERGFPVFGMQQPAEYLDLTRQLKWGVVFQGKKGVNCDGKNRREPCYASCGIPLALNYIPRYPFPMVPDKDFVYLRSPADLDLLESIDPRPYAQASLRLWNEHFSPAGAARNLLKLVARATQSQALARRP